jgi:uncharacterized protein with von Willebrand factor type A (vWA) domain
VPATDFGALISNLLHFGRLLRRLGIEVTSSRLSTLVEALSWLDLRDRAQVKDAARAVLVSHREHLPIFDRAFDLFWRAAGSRPAGAFELGRMVRRARTDGIEILSLAAESPADGSEDLPPVLERRFAWSAREVLRHKDFADLTAGEEAAVRELIRQAPFDLEVRRTRRQVPAARAGSTFDLRRTVRRSLRHGGEPVEPAFRRRKEKPRPLVALVDLSGSMEPYARLLLEFLYALAHGHARREVFAFGTRLTRLTRQLGGRDPDRALKEAAAAVADWGGGTRIGEALRRFNRDWARRVLGQGAVVLLVSDGWDRGEPELLAREMARLARSCSRLLWLNPLVGSPGYEPLTRGLVAALPHVDDLLPVGNLESLEQLGRLLGARERRRGA